MFLKRKLPATSSTTSHNGTTSASNNNTSLSTCSNNASGPLMKRPRCSFIGTNRNNATSSLSSSSSSSSSKLFAPGKKLIVQRTSFFGGDGNSTTTNTTSAITTKKFVRPMVKRRAYGQQADQALRRASLGQKRRFNGMAKLLARAGRGLSYQLPSSATNNNNNTGTDESSDDDSDDDQNEPDRPFEPLRVWKSPHPSSKTTTTTDTTTTSESKDDGDDSDNDGEDDDNDNKNNNPDSDDEPLERKGIPPRMATVTRLDEYGIEERVTVLQPAPVEAYAKQDVYVPPVLAKWLRPHQREGVTFMYKCVMGLKDYNGNGCILADDMGLGKTLQSVTLIYTLLKTGITADGQPTAKRVIVVCPCSLVKNWENEFVKWLGPGAVKTLALAEADRKTVEKNMDCFVKTKLFNILICSYECLRAHVGRLNKHKDCCDLLVCDEAHRLKNADNQTSKALSSLPVRRRVLLTGTPMQNDLQEFYAMVDFTNPGILGTPEQFRKHMLFPILRGREPDATDAQKQRMMEIQNRMSSLVNEFILRRVNTLNAQHLPPKLVQVVCCNLTDIQLNMYQHLINSKDMQHVLDGKQSNCLASIQMLMKLCNHPSLIASEDPTYGSAAVVSNKRSAATRTKSYAELDGGEPVSTAAPGADGVAKFLPHLPGGGRGNNAPVFPEWSGKMYVLYRLMKEMRKPGNGNDKIVIVSNYTQTLDLIGRMCRENSWGFCRLDGSITMKKRQKMVDDFNDPSSNLIAFLLSSKAGGCGLNLIGGNRLVLFDPDWNPAVDKQAAARCWRDGQTKRCFTYRFLATGTVEEKIFQRQLSKEGLQSVVDDKEQVNALSTKDLRNLFKLRTGTPSDTHDKLRCERCAIIDDDAEQEAKRVLPKQLAKCAELLERVCGQPDAEFFVAPLDPTQHDCTKENYEKFVKQPIDFGTIKATLAKTSDQPGAYKNVSSFSKDVNRVFGNVLKVWNPGDAIADAARNLQAWWVHEWTELVPLLMTMKASDDDNVADKKDSADEVEDLLSQSACINNERGTDYQEQLGMPDEENMRHWSHHFSTDTVDDPVFRAAMRGCDSVSFVFGLEVTWSLIQQRQQDEEEAQAAKLLEEMQENGGLNGDKSDSDTKPACCKHDGSDSDDDEEEEEAEEHKIKPSSNTEVESKPSTKNNLSKEVSVDLEDSDDDKDEDSIEASASPTSEKNESSMLDELSDGAAKNASSSKKKILALSDSSDDEDELPPTVSKKSPRSVDVMDSLAGGSNSSGDESSGVAASTTATPKNQWKCSACTFLNALSNRKCEMCETARPKAGRRRSSPRK